MIVVRITGGLGNQMFQYAFARVLQAQGKKVFIQWHGHRTKSRHNEWELNEVFQVPLSRLIPLANESVWLNLVAWTMRKTARRREPENIGYNPEFLTSTTGYLDGYWQTEKYFADIAETIRSDFRFKPLEGHQNLELEKRIAEEPCVSAHVRRGDYLNHPGLGDICSPEYYRKALVKIDDYSPGSILVVFSDDIPYCRTLFTERAAVFVDWNQGANSWMDMALMSQCRHHIIANSSFSWWGAWLSQEKEGIIIGPEKWFSNNVTNRNPDILPAHWMTCPS